MGSSVQRAAGQGVQIVAGPRVLPFIVLKLLLRSHWKSQRAGEPRGQYSVSKSPAPPLHLPCLRRLWSGSGFFHPCSKQLGIQALCWPSEEAPETTSRCAWLAGSDGPDFLLQPPPAARKSFWKQGCYGGKDAKPEKSRSLEGEFPPYIGSQVNAERAEVKKLSAYQF